jgi:hypothetical protein
MRSGSKLYLLHDQKMDDGTMMFDRAGSWMSGLMSELAISPLKTAVTGFELLLLREFVCGRSSRDWSGPLHRRSRHGSP